MQKAEAGELSLQGGSWRAEGQPESWDPRNTDKYCGKPKFFVGKSKSSGRILSLSVAMPSLSRARQMQSVNAYSSAKAV